MPPASVKLEELYESGLYVFGGWHEMNAHRELHEEYPDQDPSWSMADECKVFVFPAPASEEVLHNLRIVGAAQNKCEEVRHKKDFKDAVAHCRRAYNRNIRKKGNPQARFESAEKVFILLLS